jgi:HlyD family secretion protein
MPVHSVELKFPSTGTIAEVLVRDGATVKSGAVLARLDTRDLQLRLQDAQAALAKAKADYEQQRAGASPELIDVARAQLAHAQAHVREVRGSVIPQDIAAARAELQQALTNLDQLQHGPKDTALRAAQAVRNRANANLQTERDRLSADKNTAQLQMEQAANALRDRQTQYSQIYWENRNSGASDQGNIDREAAALRALHDAEAQLQQAQLAYEQAQKAEVSGIAATEAEVQNAQATVDQVTAGSGPTDVAAARSQVAVATANLARLQGDQHAGAVAAASADVDIAQANLNHLTTAPRDIDLASLQAQVQQAEIALKRSELALEQASLRAPMDGTVVAINLSPGQFLDATTPAIILADLTSWKAETLDLIEEDAMRVHEGDPVMMTFEALPNLKLPGKVAGIKPMGTTRPDDLRVLYTATIIPDVQDHRLRWNMTASLTIQPRN